VYVQQQKRPLQPKFLLKRCLWQLVQCLPRHSIHRNRLATNRSIYFGVKARYFNSIIDWLISSENVACRYLLSHSFCSQFTKLINEICFVPSLQVFDASTETIASTVIIVQSCYSLLLISWSPSCRTDTIDCFTRL
jgi:hypothetical protein